VPHPDSIKWNALYNSDPKRSEPQTAHALLKSHIDLLPAHGLALDIACGTSSTGRYLASRKWRVIGLDVAVNALRMAQGQARKDALSISFAVLDLSDPWLPESTFDVILDFYFLSRPLFTLYKKTLNPGGMLFFETFVWQPGIEMNPEHYLQPDELRTAFIDWDILHYEESTQVHTSDKMRKIAQLVARRPLVQDNQVNKAA
jgi:tellurite methyltransferase